MLSYMLFYSCIIMVLSASVSVLAAVHIYRSDKRYKKEIEQLKVRELSVFDLMNVIHKSTKELDKVTKKESYT